ncbi:Holliday junction branch migration protein RuvA [Candidatus Kaiserbacteria bacterium]|nr:Holliday junction branch migration protein RuvA [Candidatus Kaiserbacteria bacterium]
MIARLTGTILAVHETTIVLDVHGVGYKLFLPLPSLADISESDELSLYTHLAVRENALDLYGFLQYADLTMFELLLTLPKIGPKSALSILSQASATTLEHAICTGDATHLSKMSGIGKKSAEKIVSGLVDHFPGAVVGKNHPEHGADTDVIDALLALGYSERDAREALKNIPRDIIDTRDRITAALKQVGS